MPSYSESLAELRAEGPRVSEYLPLFHIDAAEIPSDATFEPEFECSPVLKSRRAQFYHTIRPLLVIPSFDSEATSICALEALYLSLRDEKRIQQLLDLDTYFKVIMRTWEDQYGGTTLLDRDNEHMRCERMELRIWLGMYAELEDYLDRWDIYATELALRHGRLHICSTGFYMITDLVKELNNKYPRLKRAFNPHFGDQTLMKEKKIVSSVSILFLRTQPLQDNRGSLQPLLPKSKC
ncbi:hypothetical protein B0H16DRAFT_1534813 [Mycena metata]|uniref:Uncharacterized protein n=1 Tax=Mycena metata TaxID=1033252 RepID=A0AAD7JBP6_9AGAR|nr:hypothetical protein B0H16DRAFT_1534813 [Mycena metata]